MLTERETADIHVLCVEVYFGKAILYLWKSPQSGPAHNVVMENSRWAIQVTEERKQSSALFILLLLLLLFVDVCIFSFVFV